MSHWRSLALFLPVSVHESDRGTVAAASGGSPAVGLLHAELRVARVGTHGVEGHGCTQDATHTLSASHRRPWQRQSVEYRYGVRG